MSEYATCSCGEHYGRVIGYTTDRFCGPAYVTDTCFEAMAGPPLENREKEETTLAPIYLDAEGWFVGTGGALRGAWTSKTTDQGVTVQSMRIVVAGGLAASGDWRVHYVDFYLLTVGRERSFYEVPGRESMSLAGAVDEINATVARGY